MMNFSVYRLQQKIEEDKLNESKSLIDKVIKDRKYREYGMKAAPFLVYYFIGFIFDSDFSYLVKFASLILLGLFLLLASKIIFDDNLWNIIPISVYMSTKFWLYITYIIYLLPG